MQTDDLIRQLSTGLRPAKAHFYAVSLLIWTAGTAALLGLAFYVLPARADLAARWGSGLFEGQTLLCLAVFVAAAGMAYKSAVPGMLSARGTWLGLGLFAVLGALLLSKISFTRLPSEWSGEMDFYRGRCGPIILIVGALDMVLVGLLARRGAPTQPAHTGAWIALSAGALGLFVVQFICAYDNFLHVVLWHLLPVMALSFLGVTVGRRVLQW